MIAFRLTDAALRQSCEDSEFEALRTKPRADADGITTALEEARSKPSFSRCNDEVYVSIAQELERIQQRIVAMCRDSLSSHARVLSALVPELEPLARETVHSLLGPAAATPGPREWASGVELERLRAPRQARTAFTALAGYPRDVAVSLDRMLPLWSFVLESAGSRGELESTGREIGAAVVGALLYEFSSQRNAGGQACSKT